MPNLNFAGAFTALICHPETVFSPVAASFRKVQKKQECVIFWGRLI